MSPAISQSRDLLSPLTWPPKLGGDLVEETDSKVVLGGEGHELVRHA